ncbi:MAG TPA: DUF3313 domain-containing protein [Burkholderiales bacterium]|nr:DUF3313 domain-containing protein [Burkholderiales bacterium]
MSTHCASRERPGSFKTLFAAVSVSVAALAAGGCASTTPAGPGELKQYQAVLKYPDRIRPARDAMGGYVWMASNVNWKQYDKVLLPRILVTLDDQAEYRTVDPVTQAKLVAYFRGAIVKALEPTYPVVRQGGPGVLVTRITLVDLVPVNVAEDLAYQAAPFGAGLAAELAEGPVTGEGFGSAPFLGRTGVAVQFFDGQTNQLIAEYADTQFGKQFVANFSKGISAGVQQGWEQYWKGVTSWGYADEAFTGWAQAFRAWLDRVHAK